MDQNKTNIPHIISNPKVCWSHVWVIMTYVIIVMLRCMKAIAGAYLLETHVTGLRAHGRQTIMAIDCNDFRHDSNLTIEIILKILTMLKV